MSAESFVEGTVQVGTLPAIFFKVNQAVEDPETSFSDLGRIIGADSGLTARLLKIVNSSYYGFEASIETLEHAITLVGMQEVRDMVLATTMIRYFRGVDGEALNMASFWLHSIACGIAARNIAVLRQEPGVERYYVAGLLHDIGRLVLFMNHPSEMKDALERYEQGGLLVDAELEVLGADHAQVGAALLAKWKLSDRLAATVRDHHAPNSGAENFTDAAIVHLADVLVHGMELGASGERFVPPLSAEAWKALGLDTGDLAPLLARVELQADEMAQTFL
jgi:putative nucleotidyltransferase with HDIG domain